MSEEFTDPVVRCADCQALVTREEVRKFGMCPLCGNRRMRNVLVLSEKEMSTLRRKGVGEEFLAEFEVRNG
jgi:Zn finger protein HypA/HybF involved in hydrogenase expression